MAQGALPSLGSGFPVIPSERQELGARVRPPLTDKSTALGSVTNFFSIRAVRVRRISTPGGFYPPPPGGLGRSLGCPALSTLTRRSMPWMGSVLAIKSNRAESSLSRLH